MLPARQLCRGVRNKYGGASLNQGGRSCHILLDCTGRACPASSAGEIRLFSKLRNERLRLPAFLKHYRELGVDRFFIVDNGSSDGSTEYLLAQKDVHVFRTHGSFRDARGGTEWLNALLVQFGLGAWCITVDIDELLWFPGSDTANLHRLTRYFDSKGYQAFACLLLDLYPDGPLRCFSYAPEEDLLTAVPYFDAGPYVKIPGSKRQSQRQCPGFVIQGGVRQRVFYPEVGDNLWWKVRWTLFNRFACRLPLLGKLSMVRRYQAKTSPNLTKVPLVRWDSESRYLAANHYVTPKVLAPESGVLLHFKFLQDFHEKAVQEAARGEYAGGGTEYKRYSMKLKADPDLSLMYEGSIRLKDCAQLVEMGLMHDSDAWERSRERIEAWSARA